MDSDTIKKFSNKDCGVSEEFFLFMLKFCCKNSAVFVASYEKICPYCDISASLPYGESLKIVTIFECRKFGYGKRVTG